MVQDLSRHLIFRGYGISIVSLFMTNFPCWIGACQITMEFHYNIISWGPKASAEIVSNVIIKFIKFPGFWIKLHWIGSYGCSPNFCKMHPYFSRLNYLQMTRVYFQSKNRNVTRKLQITNQTRDGSKYTMNT